MVVWGSTSGWKRALLAAQMAIALALGVLADSRSPFVGLAVGGLLYLIWRYRLRAVPIIVVLGVVRVRSRFPAESRISHARQRCRVSPDVPISGGLRS